MELCHGLLLRQNTFLIYQNFILLETSTCLLIITSFFRKQTLDNAVKEMHFLEMK